MTPCVCGHWHVVMCACGCSIYEPDNGRDTATRDLFDARYEPIDFGGRR